MKHPGAEEHMEDRGRRLQDRSLTGLANHREVNARLGMMVRMRGIAKSATKEAKETSGDGAGLSTGEMDVGVAEVESTGRWGRSDATLKKWKWELGRREVDYAIKRK